MRTLPISTSTGGSFIEFGTIINPGPLPTPGEAWATLEPIITPHITPTSEWKHAPEVRWVSLDDGRCGWVSHASLINRAD